jgi:hypothetical protein
MPLRRFGMRLAVMPHLLLQLRQPSLRGTAMMVMYSPGHDTFFNDKQTGIRIHYCPKKNGIVEKFKHHGKGKVFNATSRERAMMS